MRDRRLLRRGGFLSLLAAWHRGAVCDTFAAVLSVIAQQGGAPEPPWHWYVGIITGLLGGAIWSAVWELWIRPYRDRRGVSLALAAEIARASYVIRAAHDEWSLPRVDLPAMFGVVTQVYLALADQLSALPAESLTFVVALYGEFAWLNRAPLEFDRLEGQRQNGDMTARFAVPQLEQLLDEFERRLRSTLPMCEGACKELGRPIPPYITGVANLTLPPTQ